MCLDSNDLVQFFQWRALSSLPNLRKLSLASNRVKKLVDDSGDTTFSTLQELVLSSNEIATADSLHVLRRLPRLRVLNLSDNPCGDVKVGRAAVIASDRRPPRNVHRLKLDRKTMTKISSTLRTRRPTQLGVLDAQELVIPGVLTAWPEVRKSTADVFPLEVLRDEISEDDLDRILFERRKRIDEIFQRPADDPCSFMRPVPFQAVQDEPERAHESKAGPCDARNEVGPRLRAMPAVGDPSKFRPFPQTAFLPRLPAVRDPHEAPPQHLKSRPKVADESVKQAMSALRTLRQNPHVSAKHVW